MNAISRPFPPRGPIPEIRLSGLQIGLRNHDRRNREVFADCRVTVGAFSFSAYLAGSGEVDLPQCLECNDTRLEIARRFREAALVEAAARWGALSGRERQHLETIRRPTQGKHDGGSR